MAHINALDQGYFMWLVGSVDPSKTHIKLLQQLYESEAEALIPWDENRLDGGIAIRNEFRPGGYSSLAEMTWLTKPCTFLELTIVLSRTLADEMNWTTKYAFWTLLRNIGVADISDIEYDSQMRSHIHQVVNKINARSYDYYGRGGFFPLRNAKQNQQLVQLWDQLNAWVIENDVLEPW